MAKTQRQSNIELLRIIAMLMVLILHGTFMANGSPSYQSIISHPFGAGFYSLVEALTVVAVDCYVLISGYFAIKPTLKKFLYLYFMIAFWRACCLFAQSIPITAKDILQIFNLFGGGWFVGAYMALFIFSPILNIFAERSTKSEFKRGLLIYLLSMIILGWIIPASYSHMFNFSKGYSVFTLIGVYLIGRYIRLHGTPWRNKAPWRWICVYLGCCVANTLGYMILRGLFGTALMGSITTDMFISYNNPMVVLGALSLLLAFINVKIAYNRVINWLAASSFAVYLIHTGPFFLSVFKQCTTTIYHTFWPWLWLPVLLAFAIAVYLLCTLGDQVRKLLWDLLLKAYHLFAAR